MFLSLKEFVRRSVHKVKNTAAGEDVIKNNSYVVANTYANRLVECCTSLTFYSLQIEWLKWLNTFFLFSLLWVSCPVWLTGCVAQVHVLVFFTRGRPRLRTCVCWICWVESVFFFLIFVFLKKTCDILTLAVRQHNSHERVFTSLDVAWEVRYFKFQYSNFIFKFLLNTLS